MFTLLTALAFATLALAQTRRQDHTIFITNNCDFDVSYRVDSHRTTGGVVDIPSGGTNSLDLSGPGNAVKFVTAADPDWAQPISFDYSVPETEPNRVYYDVSDVGGFPFGVWGVPVPLACDIVGCPGNEQGAGEAAVCGLTRSCESDALFTVYTCYKPENVAVRERLRLGARVEQGIRMMK